LSSARDTGSDDGPLIRCRPVYAVRAIGVRSAMSQSLLINAISITSQSDAAMNSHHSARKVIPYTPAQVAAPDRGKPRTQHGDHRRS